MTGDDPRRDPLHTSLALATFVVMALLTALGERFGLGWRVATMAAAVLATAFCCSIPFFLHRLPEVRVPRERRTIFHYGALAATALVAIALLAFAIPWWVVFATYVLSALSVYVSYQVFAFVLARRARRMMRP